MLSGTWAFSCPYLALVDGPMLGSACEHTHGKEVAELIQRLEGDRETWAREEQDLEATAGEERNKGRCFGMFVFWNWWVLVHLSNIFASDISFSSGSSHLVWIPRPVNFSEPQFLCVKCGCYLPYK